MTKLICSGCNRSVDVDKVYGNEVCKECGKPMKKVTDDKTKEKPKEKIIEEKEKSKITLPTADNLCGELPNFADKSII